MDLTVTYRPNPLLFSSAPLAKDAHTSILFKLPWKQRPTISRHKPVLRVLASANANGSDGFSWSSLARSVQQGSMRFWSNFGESLKKDTGFDLEDANVKVGEFVGSVRERVEKSGVVLERFRSDVVPEFVSWNQWERWKGDDPHVIPANMTPEVSELFTRELTRHIEETEELAMNGLMNNRHILDVIALKLLENSRITGLELGFNGTSSMALASANLLKTSTFNRFLFLQPFSHPFQSSFFIPEPLRPGTTTKSLCFPKRQVVPRSALREWKEYEEAVKRKDLAGALRFLKSAEDQRSPIEPVNNGSFPAESTQSRLGELGPLGRERDWEVLDTCLNADDLKLVGNAYGLLKGRGLLPSFGKFRNIVLEGPRNVTPTVLKDSTGLEVTKFAPKKWGLSESSSPVLIGFLGGASFLIWQGIDLRPNLAVILGLAFIDSIFLGGCCLAQISSYWPPNRRRILIHEAGHLLIAYLMGCPVRGVILDPIVAVQMGIQGQAGTQFWDEKMANDLAEGRLDGIAFDRYSMVLFAGIAAEALIYGEAEGGENDENLFRSTCLLLQPPLSIAEMSNQARWSLLQSYNLLKWHKNAHQAAVKALESRSSLSDVIRRIEEAMANSN